MFGQIFHAFEIVGAVLVLSIVLSLSLALAAVTIMECERALNKRRLQKMLSVVNLRMKEHKHEH